MKKFVIGVDFGTDSVRSLIVNASNGEEIASAVSYYERWKSEKYCDPINNKFRQHPLDYIEGLEISIKNAIKSAPPGTASNIVGLSVDTTGSTPVAVDENCIPLAMKKGFEDNPNAMFILWKDHTSVKEAEEINITSKSNGNIDYTKYIGGVYSSEWFWAKILHTLREDKDVRKNAYSWVEHCDWIPALLTDNRDPKKLKRSRCAAGHKAMWHEEFKGLPDDDFLASIDPLLKNIREKLYYETYTNDQKAGIIAPYWADRLGLNKNTIIGVGAFDAHMGAVGGGIEPYVLCKIIGTSTCDILVAPIKDIGNKLIKGICGQVDGSVLPDMLGMEAGQSAYGDIYAWFKKLLLWPLEYSSKKTNKIDYVNFKQKIIQDIDTNIIPYLSIEAEKIPAGQTDIVSLDWMNGRRTPYANQLLKGAITGLNLGSDAPRIFRSLVETTAFGAKKIVERFIDEGVQIKSVIAMGGVAKKSPFVIQVLADVLNMNIKIVTSEQACALGAAMCAAAASGIYNSLSSAQKSMGSGFEKEYKPDSNNAAVYKKIYEKYSKLAEFIENDFTK
ncbi:MAG: ribulokinase [Spirochaetes bacterium]|nr:ribulokinase [Spirochaetota bacterium]